MLQKEAASPDAELSATGPTDAGQTGVLAQPVNQVLARSSVRENALALVFLINPVCS
jgi:hypothetical protein